MSTITELLSKIRDVIDEYPQIFELAPVPKTNRKKFDVVREELLLTTRVAQVASALDAAQAAQAAIESFQTIKAKSNVELYLITYGVLQSAYVQQDALEHIGKALGITISYHSFDELEKGA